MKSSKAQELSAAVQDKAIEFKKLCETVISDDAAAEAPSGRWSPKEIVSHLLGPDGFSVISMFQSVLEEDTPFLEIKAEDPFLSEKRQNVKFEDLVSQFEAEYNRVAGYVAGLSDEQLSRKAHVPLFKDSQIGEYPTLAGLIEGIGVYHVTMHIEHMREVLHGLQAG